MDPLQLMPPLCTNILHHYEQKHSKENKLFDSRKNWKTSWISAQIRFTNTVAFETFYLKPIPPFNAHKGMLDRRWPHYRPNFSGRLNSAVVPLNAGGGIMTIDLQTTNTKADNIIIAAFPLRSLQVSSRQAKHTLNGP